MSSSPARVTESQQLPRTSSRSFGYSLLARGEAEAPRKERGADRRVEPQPPGRRVDASASRPLHEERGCVLGTAVEQTFVW